jgi:pimeloyl-ACP methyl ester carboxylesterase
LAAPDKSSDIAYPDIRVIAYDQRGHGRSGRGCALSNTLGQLARDLDAVIDTTTPTGHIVLVGHSMGAMTILQHLQHHQSRNTDRITGVGLMANFVMPTPMQTLWTFR